MALIPILYVVTATPIILLSIVLITTTLMEMDNNGYSALLKTLDKTKKEINE